MTKIIYNRKNTIDNLKINNQLLESQWYLHYLQDSWGWIGFTHSRHHPWIQRPTGNNRKTLRLSAFILFLDYETQVKSHPSSTQEYFFWNDWRLLTTLDLPAFTQKVRRVKEAVSLCTGWCRELLIADWSLRGEACTGKVHCGGGREDPLRKVRCIRETKGARVCVWGSENLGAENGKESV